MPTFSDRLNWTLPKVINTKNEKSGIEPAPIRTSPRTPRPINPSGHYCPIYDVIFNDSMGDQLLRSDDTVVFGCRYWKIDLTMQLSIYSSYWFVFCDNELGKVTGPEQNLVVRYLIQIKAAILWLTTNLHLSGLCLWSRYNNKYYDTCMHF